MTPEQTKTLLPIIQAFADGQDIQFQHNGETSWINITDPVWATTTGIYRIKPPTMWYRVALLTNNSCYTLTSSEAFITEQKVEACENFIRWLSPRVEYTT